MRPTLILDLDGTLVDSAPDLQAAVNRLMAARGLPAFSRAAVVGMIGDGIVALVDRALAAHGLPPDPSAVDAVRADYAIHYADLTRPYPGVPETLAAMAADGWRLTVCTNKPEAPARDLLAALHLDKLFDAVVGGDGPRKPDPAHTLAALAGGDRRAAVAVGDHSNDVRAAVAAGIPCIFAEWGYGTPAMAAGSAAAAGSFDGLPVIARRLLSRA